FRRTAIPRSTSTTGSMRCGGTRSRRSGTSRGAAARSSLLAHPPAPPEHIPHLVGACRLEDLPSAARGVLQSFRVPGQVLLHLDEGVLLAEVPADQIAVAS